MKNIDEELNEKNINSNETADNIAKRFKDNPKTKEQYQEIIKWCSKNCDKLDLNDENQVYLYEMSTRYLMKYKIGKWEKCDANVIINYLAKKSAWKLGIEENITVNILEQEEYKNDYGNTSEAICINNGDDTFNIKYSPKVIDNLLSNDYNQFLRGMQTIFHEVVHAQQNSVIQRANIKGVDIPKTKTVYIMALETIARKFNSEFYNSNYSHLIKENHAEKIGLKEAMQTMQKYNTKLYQAYNQDIINQRLENYDKNFYEAEITLSDGRTIDFMRQIDTLSSMYIEQHPEMIEKYPILQVGYNLDGTKKDLRQLLIEREKMLEDSETPEKINELYEAIANHRNVLTGGLNGTKEELVALHDYIEKTGTEDEFVFSLIKYRLEQKTKMDQKQIDEFMKREYACAAKVRQEKIHNEDQTEAVWKNRFKSWDGEAANISNSAKRKEEVVQVLRNIEKQKGLEEQEEMEGKNRI